MAMNYTSLIAPKGTSGSIANWAGYAKLDLPPILDEAQSLVYNMLRVREMRSEWTFRIVVGAAGASLPDRYLDPSGPCHDTTNGGTVPHIISDALQDRRAYEQLTGSLGSNPFTTVAGSSSVTVHQVAHGITQGSTITFAGGSTVDVFNPNTAYPVTAVVDVDNYTIDIDTPAATSVSGGGASVTYSVDRLVSGSPSAFTIMGTGIRFDTAHDVATNYRHRYYRKPLLLSATNQSNFLTDRYPRLLRAATQCAAAEFMEDDAQYQKQITTFVALIQNTVEFDDLSYRGASFGTDTP